jgi:hypothetical protein
MKEKLHKSGSVFMALLLLFSTMSFSMDMHFCGDHLVDFSLFDKADSCGMMSESPSASSDCAMIAVDIDCCSDVQIIIDGQEDFKVSFDQLTFGQQFFLASLVYSYVNLFERDQKGSPADWKYEPPPLIRDIQTLHQTFLI